MKTSVVNIVNGFPADGIYIGRSARDQAPSDRGYFGNPYAITTGQDRRKVLDLYEHYFFGRMRSDIQFEQAILALASKTLVCFCKPLACHGDIIAKYLNAKET